jgi:integrase
LYYTEIAYFAKIAGTAAALYILPVSDTGQRIRAYLDAAGHADDLDGPLFRPLSHNCKGQEEGRQMAPDAINRVLRKHATASVLTQGYSAHSMRATFITTAHNDGATLDDVQRAAGHAEPGTAKLYDRRGYNPEKSASSSRRPDPCMTCIPSAGTASSSSA